MKKPYPRYSQKTFEQIIKDFDFDFNQLYQHRDDLLQICDDMKNISSELIITSLKKYIIIRLVTLIEDSFKRLVKSQIDLYDLEPPNIMKDIDRIKTKNIVTQDKHDNVTNGVIIASSYNLQNPRIINYVCSNMTKIPFFETIEKLLRLPNDPTVNYDKDWAMDRKKLYENWSRFLHINDIRNNLIHTTENRSFNNVELHRLIYIVSDAITFSAIFIQIFIEIWQNKCRKELDMELDMMLGNNSKIAIDIIKKENSKFSD